MSPASPLPPATSLPSLPPSDQTHILDLLFEPSPPLHALSLPLFTRPIPSYPALIAAIRSQLTALSTSTSLADAAQLDAILGAHPRLGAKKVDSAQSAAEQAQLGGGEEEARQLAALNEEYEAKFPGLRYVVFVNGRGRGEIMKNMRERIDRGDGGLEREEGIKAMCDIAVDRATKIFRENGGDINDQVA
ncbi:hypothetical protein V497_02272 [Pseudogymnoascus sp. VKM F-4516 (FW-969)]|nr:hypothetical protein V497_02272 [Pseudogymnoascus sp. VKM F-4516 (FW-969)]